MSDPISQVVAVVRDAVREVLSVLEGALHSYLGTGLLGLAIGIAIYWHARGNRPAGDRTGGAAQAPTQPQQQQPQQGQQQQPARPAATQQGSSKPTAATPVGRAVQARLSGVKRIVISCPGVLFEQWQAEDLQEGANLRPKIKEILSEICRLRGCDVYLLTQVVDDVGQAVVTGALEAAGLLGPSSSGCVPPQRLLFCSTAEGKVAIVRQLEPELHIDAQPSTVDELRRFLPQLLFVQRPGAALAGAAAPNVAQVPSLATYLGVA